MRLILGFPESAETNENFLLICNTFENERCEKIDRENN